MEVKRDFIFDPSLALYLPLYELDGASFMSKDAHGHLCTVTGALWRHNGRYFDGIDDYIQISNPAFASNQQGTVEIWIRADNIASLRGIWCYVYPPSASVDALRLSITTNGNVRYDVYLNGSYEVDIQTPNGSFSVNTWHLISTISDGASIKIYINGIEQSLTVVSGSNTGQWFGDCVTDADTFVAGGYLRLDTLVSDFAGSIGEVGIYSRVLTPQEIQHNYEATKWRYR